MKYLYSLLIITSPAIFAFSKTGNPGLNVFNILPVDKDTAIAPAGISAAGDSTRVIISNGQNGLEFSPLHSFNNGLLIQPINRSTNTGLPTAFYLGDTASWSFYTDAKKRLIINGNGDIATTSHLLINNAVSDGISALRVKGNVRFDSSFCIQAESDTNSFISFERNAKDGLDPVDDKISPYTVTPTQWAAGKNLPVFRIRHPLNVSGVEGINTSIQRDFKILPYEFGTAIEYNGVVECWVGLWSIHMGVYYNDVEGKGNGWGGVFWVGNDVDNGGVRATARNNNSIGGNVLYGELSVEDFSGYANGDFRFRLPSNQNQFHFVYGERGSTNIVAKVSDKGFFLPVVSSAALITTPEKGQVYFDSSASQFKGYDGSQWKNLANDLITGAKTTSADGLSLIYKIAHGLSGIPSYFNVLATSSAAANISYVTADATYISIYYTDAPAFGSNNLTWNWQAKR